MVRKIFDEFDEKSINTLIFQIYDVVTGKDKDFLKSMESKDFREFLQSTIIYQADYVKLIEAYDIRRGRIPEPITPEKASLLSNILKDYGTSKVLKEDDNIICNIFIKKYIWGIICWKLFLNWIRFDIPNH